MLQIELESEYGELKATEKQLTARLALTEADLCEKSRQAEAFSLHAKNRDLTTDQKVAKFVLLMFLQYHSFTISLA